MDEDPNQLIEAPEDDDINDLNDETFGNYVENCRLSFHYIMYVMLLTKDVNCGKLCTVDCGP